MGTASATSSTRPCCRSSSSISWIGQSREAKMRKWFPAVLIGAAVAFAAWAHPRLSAHVSLRWDLFVPWVPSHGVEPMPRGVVAFGTPVLALAIWLLFIALASRAGESLGRRLFPAWMVSE